MSTLVLTNEDLQRLVREVGIDSLMDELTDRFTVALQEFDPQNTEVFLRTGFYYDEPQPGLIEWMPLFQRNESVLMKIVGYHPASPTIHQLPTIVSTFSMYDTSTGCLRALVDGTFLTAMRTGVASAVASRWLARKDSSTLGLVGCGAQAITQFHALSRVFDLHETLIYDIDATTRDSFAERARSIAPDGVEIRTADVDEVVAKSDIVCVATSVKVGQGPVFEAQETKPWLHINAVGSDLPGKTELPLYLLHDSFICADFPEQAFSEGECQQLEARDKVMAFSELARQPQVFDDARRQRSVFDSTGWALEDQVAMEVVLDHAETLGIGSLLPIECIPVNPKNPYEFLASDAYVAADDID